MPLLGAFYLLVAAVAMLLALAFFAAALLRVAWVLGLALGGSCLRLLQAGGALARSGWR